MREHSPLPWRLHEDSDTHIISAADGLVLFEVSASDARLIVTAVNSHAALLAAAKDIVHHSYAHGLKSINGTHIAKLDAAIAKAEEPAS